MSHTVVEILRTWFENRSEEGARLSSDELFAWAGLFGADLERAWTECARGDHAVVVAAACSAQLEPIALAAIDAADRAQELLPPRIDVGRRAVALARRIVVGAAPFLEVESELEGVEARLRTQIERRRREIPGRRLAHDDLFERACVELAARMTLALHGSPPSEPGPIGSVERAPFAMAITLRFAEVEARFKSTKLAAAFSASCQRIAHANAELSALDAAAAALVAAACAAAAALLAPVHRLVAAEGCTEGDYVEAIEHLENARETVFVKGTSALVAAVAAARDAACGTSEATAAALSTLGGVAFRTALGNEVTAEEMVALSLRIVGISEAAAGLERSKQAATLRAHLAFSELRPPLDEQQERELMRTDGREQLRSRIAALEAPLRVWGDGAALEAVEVVTAILEAPGALDRDALAAALLTMHERAAELFAARAAETDDDEIRANARAVSEGAEAAAREMKQVVVDRGPAPSN